MPGKAARFLQTAQLCGKIENFHYRCQKRRQRQKEHYRQFGHRCENRRFRKGASHEGKNPVLAGIHGAYERLIIVTGAQGPLPPVPSAAATTPANPQSVYSFLLPNAAQKHSCRTSYCNSPLGPMMSAADWPILQVSGSQSAIAGQQEVPAGDARAAADNLSGLAAMIKQDEEDAKKRQANIRFLGTVDCSYWPEAADALCSALRKDKNECVRYEAALAMHGDCCCNPKSMEALKNCVLGRYRADLNNPVEYSARSGGRRRRFASLCENHGSGACCCCHSHQARRTSGEKDPERSGVLQAPGADAARGRDRRRPQRLEGLRRQSWLPGEFEHLHFQLSSESNHCKLSSEPWLSSQSDQCQLSSQSRLSGESDQCQLSSQSWLSSESDPSQLSSQSWLSGESDPSQLSDQSSPTNASARRSQQFSPLQPTGQRSARH